MVDVANRTALRQQVMKDIPDAYKDSIVACSYQRFAKITPYPKRITTQHLQEDVEIASGDYYVLDEAHYFLADSEFNSDIEDCFLIMEGLRKNNEGSVWIYMTATIPYLLLQMNKYHSLQTVSSSLNIPYLNHEKRGAATYYRDNIEFPYDSEEFRNSVKALLQYKEQQDDNIYDYLNMQRELEEWGNPRMGPFAEINNLQNYFTKKLKSINAELNKNIQEKYNYYFLEWDLSYINPVYFEQWDEIVAAVTKAPESEKWLIFVDSKKRGESLEQMFWNEGVKAVFITAERKNNRDLEEHSVFQQIVERANFQQHVLIATKVLDNGVNLKDPSLKHIVIEAYEETTFLQMLGRKRQMDRCDQVHLYLQNVSEGSLRKRFRNQILEILSFWYRLYKLQERRDCQNNLRFELKSFLEKYTDHGHYKRPYAPFVIEEKARYPIDQWNVKEDSLVPLVDMYKPTPYATRKFAYDYYKMMAMFEQAQNERQRILERAEELNEKEKDRLEKSSQEKQFMWLKCQLSWLGLNTPEHDPAKPENWLTYQTGAERKAKQSLLEFLHERSFNDFLSEAEENDLKVLFCTWIQSVRPKHKDAGSRGSISVMNRCFEEFQIPYQVRSIKKTFEKKQRNWWVIVAT